MTILEYHPLALTTSRQLKWSNGVNSTTTWFGSAPASDPAAVESDAVGEGVSEEFYWRAPTTTSREQSLLRTTSRQLTDGSTVRADGWSNDIALHMDQANYLPGYRIAGARLSTTDFSDATAGFTPIDISVQATIMVRDGSFFVLPAPAMARSGIDLNGDNSTDDKDTAAATVYRRLNYHLEIQGNIAQNLAPTGIEDYDTTPDADGKAVGATARWLDTASYPRIASGSPLTTSGSKFGGGVGVASWDTVSYVADSEPLTITNSEPLPLPVTPDLLYVS